MPKVSVITATYNGSEYLKHVSIPSILNQTFKDFEFIIIGDYLEESERIKVEKVIESFNDNRISFYNMGSAPWYRNESFNIGSNCWNVAGARCNNFGLNIARGNIIVNLDQDDYLVSNHIQTVVDFLENNKEYDGCYTAAEVHQHDRFNGIMSQEWNPEILTHHNILIHATMAWRLDGCLEDVRYITEPEDAWRPTDWDMWLQFAAKGATIKHIPKVTAKYLQRCGLQYSLGVCN